MKKSEQTVGRKFIQNKQEWWQFTNEDGLITVFNLAHVTSFEIEHTTKSKDYRWSQDDSEIIIVNIFVSGEKCRLIFSPKQKSAVYNFFGIK